MIRIQVRMMLLTGIINNFNARIIEHVKTMNFSFFFLRLLRIHAKLIISLSRLKYYLFILYMLIMYVYCFISINFNNLFIHI